MFCPAITTAGGQTLRNKINNKILDEKYEIHMALIEFV